MSFSVPVFYKADSYSVHSTQSSFKNICELRTQNLVGPFVKLQHLFVKKPNHKLSYQRLGSKQQSCYKKKNVSYINLCMDENQQKPHSNPKGTFPNRLKVKQVRTERNDRNHYHLTFHQKPKQSKRHRHRSSVHLEEKYTLLAPNRPKENLQKFQKKLIDSLQKKDFLSKNSHNEYSTTMSIIQHFKTQPIIENSFSGRISKQKDGQSKISAQKVNEKRKVTVSKHQHHQNMSFYLSEQNHQNKTQPILSKKNKLSSKCFGQKSTLISMYPFFRGGQRSHQKNLSFPQSFKEKESLNIEVVGRYEPSVVATHKATHKFKLAKINRKYQQLNGENQTSRKQLQSLQESRCKLKKLLKRRNKRLTHQNNQFLAPWDCLPSQKEIDISS